VRTSELRKDGSNKYIVLFPYNVSPPIDLLQFHTQTEAKTGSKTETVIHNTSVISTFQTPSINSFCLFHNIRSWSHVFDPIPAEPVQDRVYTINDDRLVEQMDRLKNTN